MEVKISEKGVFDRLGKELEVGTILTFAGETLPRYLEGKVRLDGTVPVTNVVDDEEARFKSIVDAQVEIIARQLDGERREERKNDADRHEQSIKKLEAKLAKAEAKLAKVPPVAPVVPDVPATTSISAAPPVAPPVVPVAPKP